MCVCACLRHQDENKLSFCRTEMKISICDCGHLCVCVGGGGGGTSSDNDIFIHDQMVYHFFKVAIHSIPKLVTAAVIMKNSDFRGQFQFYLNISDSVTDDRLTSYKMYGEKGGQTVTSYLIGSPSEYKIIKCIYDFVDCKLCAGV